MKAAVVAVILLVASARAFAPEPVHKFDLWGILSSPNSKNNFYLGFTNGLMLGAGKMVSDDGPIGQRLVNCLSGKDSPSRSQAIAMIDKYYKENPEQWNVPIGVAFFLALTAKNGPCPANQ